MCDAALSFWIFESLRVYCVLQTALSVGLLDISIFEGLLRDAVLGFKIIEYFWVMIYVSALGFWIFEYLRVYCAMQCWDSRYLRVYCVMQCWNSRYLNM